MSVLGAGSGSGYPGALDTSQTEVDWPDPGATINRAAPINDLYSACIAIQTELGTNPSGAFGNINLRLTDLQTQITNNDSDIATLTTNVENVIENNTSMLIIGSVPSVGWVQNNTYNDRVLRVVDNTGVGGFTGGSWTLSGVTVDNHTLTAAQSGVGSHVHTYSEPTFSAGSTVGASSQSFAGFTTNSTSVVSADASQAHNHGLTSDALWRPLYVDAIICDKT